MDIGDGCTQICPIVDGFSVKNAVKRTDLAGRDVTEYLMALLKRSGYVGLHTSSEFQIVRTIKEKFCKVSMAPLTEDFYMKEMDDKNGKAYVLPDGSSINLSQDLCMEAPEILFNPAKIGLEYPGLPELMMSAIMNCDIELRKVLYSNIILAGGTTAMNQFSERFHKSLKTPAPGKVKIMAPANRRTSCWIGGSTLSSIKSFESMWITKEDYKSVGPSIIYAKGFN